MGVHRTAASTLRTILAEDGVRGLWRGTGPTVLRLSAGVAINMLVLERLKSLVLSHMDTSSGAGGGASLGMLQAALVGGGARALSAAAMSPITLVKTRMEVGGPARKLSYSNTLHALTSIMAMEGPTGVLRGLVPTVLTNAPFSALYYALYTRMQAMFGEAAARLQRDTADPLLGQLAGGRQQQQQQQQSQAVEGRQQQVHWQQQAQDGAGAERRPSSGRAAQIVVPQALVNFGAGLCAAVAATLLTQPADVVRTRVQLGLGGNASALETLGQVLRSSGPRGLLTGAAPRVVKRTLQTALVWTIYEDLVPRLSALWLLLAKAGATQQQ